MAFLIPDPQLSTLDRAWIRLWAQHDSDTVSDKNFEEPGYFKNNRVRSFEKKTREAIERELANRNSRKWKHLKAAYADYSSSLKKLQATREAKTAAIAEATGLRLEGDGGLSQSAMEERKAARAVKPSRSYAAAEAALRDKLDRIAQEANTQYDLPGYQAERLDAKAHCFACETHFYYWPAELYIQYLLSFGKLTDRDAKPEPFDFDWESRLNEVLPELDFSQHEGL